MPTAPIQGNPLFYASRGEAGAPVVFVHGAGSNHLIWNAQMSDLSSAARTYAPDLPGHGRSGGVGRNSIRAYADVICVLLDSLSLERAIIAGHSMGGAIAQTLALENPDRVLGLVLVGTGARLRVQPSYLEGILNDFAGTAHRFNESEFSPHADPRLKELSEKQLVACDPQVVHGDLVACDEFDVMSRVSDIRVPTLVLCGLQDQMTPPKYSQFLASKIPDSRLVLIERAGHMLMLEQPAQTTRALADWISINYPQTSLSSS